MAEERNNGGNEEKWNVEYGGKRMIMKIMKDVEIYERKMKRNMKTKYEKAEMMA